MIGRDGNPDQSDTKDVGQDILTLRQNDSVNDDDSLNTSRSTEMCASPTELVTVHV